MKKLYCLFFAFAGVLSSLMAQTPAHFDLNVQLKENNNPVRDSRLDVEISIMQGTTSVYIETHSSVWTNYDGYLSIQVGKRNPTQWNQIDWNAATKEIEIKGRTNGQPAAQYKVLYKGALPVAVYAQNARTYSHSKTGVGSLRLFTDATHPNIELFGNDPVSNFPYLDFATNASAEDMDFVARIHPENRNLIFYSRGGASIFRKWPLASQVEVLTRGNAGIYLKGGFPIIEFYSSMNGNPDARIHLITNEFSISSFGKNMILDAGSNSINFTANKYNFNGGPIEVYGSGNFGNDDYTYLAYRDISRLAPDYGVGIYYGTGCDCDSDGNYAPFNTNNRLGTGSGNPLYSIKTSQGIKATYFHAYSDKRIKVISGSGVSKNDLSILNGLKVFNYSYKDRLQYGIHQSKGFIAQDVEQVFPEAVSKTTDVIPDIFQVGKNVIYDQSTKTLSVTVDSLSNLSVGDKVRLLGEQPHLVEVVAVNGTSFKVKDWPETNTKEVFVYGREVNDFRTLDYDQIFTLNVSATQALSKEVEEMRTQVTALKQVNASLQSENQTLKEELRKVNSRIDAVAKMLENKSKSAAFSSTGTN